MRRKTYFLLALLLLSSMLFISCSSENANVEQEDSLSAEEKDVENIDEVTEEEVEEVALPEESQQVTEFPWDEDEDFKAALEEKWYRCAHRRLCDRF